MSERKREKERLQSGLQVHELKQSCRRRQGREAVCVCSCVCVCVCVGGRGIHRLSIQWPCLNSTTFLHCTRKMIVSVSFFSSVQFSRSVVSDSLRPHELQHARLPWSSPTPGVYSNSRPLSRWCHPTISFCHPLLLPPSIFPSIRVFPNEKVLHIMWPKHWSFSFSISPSNEHPGLISFRMDWLDLLAVQGILKSLLCWFLNSNEPGYMTRA